MSSFYVSSVTIKDRDIQSQKRQNSHFEDQRPYSNAGPELPEEEQRDLDGADLEITTLSDTSNTVTPGRDTSSGTNMSGMSARRTLTFTSPSPEPFPGSGSTRKRGKTMRRRKKGKGLKRKKNPKRQSKIGLKPQRNLKRLKRQQSDSAILRRKSQELGQSQRVTSPDVLLQNGDGTSMKEDLFNGSDVKYKQKMEEIAVYGSEYPADLNTLKSKVNNEQTAQCQNGQNGSNNKNVENSQNIKYSLEPLEAILEILKHPNVDRRVFSYELEYHRQILDGMNAMESTNNVDRVHIERSSDMLSRLLLNTVKRISDIEIIPNRVYCFGHTRDQSLNQGVSPNRDSIFDILYIVLPPQMAPIEKLDKLLMDLHPERMAGESRNSYNLYLFEAPKHIVSMPVGTSLHTQSEYGIISQMLGYIPRKAPSHHIRIPGVSSIGISNRHSAQSSRSSPLLNADSSDNAAISPRTVMEKYLKQLIEHHDRNKARVIYVDLLNRISVPAQHIEFAIEKCAKFGHDFNISLLKKLMIPIHGMDTGVRSDKTDKLSTESTQSNQSLESGPSAQEGTIEFSNTLRRLVETVCESFKYMEGQDAYLYIPSSFAHKFVEERPLKLIDSTTGDPEDDALDETASSASDIMANDADDADDNIGSSGNEDNSVSSDGGAALQLGGDDSIGLIYQSDTLNEGGPDISAAVKLIEHVS